MKIEINKDGCLSTITTTITRTLSDEMIEILEAIAQNGYYEQRGSDCNNPKYNYAIHVLLYLNIVESDDESWHFTLKPSSKSCFTQEHIQALLKTNTTDNNDSYNFSRY